MRTVNLSDAAIQLARLVEQAASGEAFIIAKDGKPLVRVLPFNPPVAAKASRVGFLAGYIRVPDDFDRMGREEIEASFEGR